MCVKRTWLLGAMVAALAAPFLLETGVPDRLLPLLLVIAGLVLPVPMLVLPVLVDVAERAVKLGIRPNPRLVRDYIETCTAAVLMAAAAMLLLFVAVLGVKVAAVLAAALLAGATTLWAVLLVAVLRLAGAVYHTSLVLAAQEG